MLVTLIHTTDGNYSNREGEWVWLTLTPDRQAVYCAGSPQWKEEGSVWQPRLVTAVDSCKCQGQYSHPHTDS